jgi:hypothetical protein
LVIDEDVGNSGTGGEGLVPDFRSVDEEGLALGSVVAAGNGGEISLVTGFSSLGGVVGNLGVIHAREESNVSRNILSTESAESHALIVAVGLFDALAGGGANRGVELELGVGVGAEVGKDLREVGGTELDASRSPAAEVVGNLSGRRVSSEGSGQDGEDSGGTEHGDAVLAS